MILPKRFIDYKNYKKKNDEILLQEININNDNNGSGGPCLNEDIHLSQEISK